MSDTPWTACFDPTAPPNLQEMQVKFYWFNPALPAGTAYAFSTRCHDVDGIFALTIPDFQRLSAAAPWQFNIATRFLERRVVGRGANAADIRDAFGRFLDYYISGNSSFAPIRLSPPSSRRSSSRSFPPACATPSLPTSLSRPRAESSSAIRTRCSPPGRDETKLTSSWPWTASAPTRSSNMCSCAA